MLLFVRMQNKEKNTPGSRRCENLALLFRQKRSNYFARIIQLLCMDNYKSYIAEHKEQAEKKRMVDLF